MPWLEANLTIDKSRAPLIEQLFEELGAVAVTFGDAGDEPVLEPGPGETPLWEATRVTGLFAGDTDVDSLRSMIGLALGADDRRSLKLKRVNDRDWERAWMDHYRPMRFGRRLWIRPSGSEVDQDDAVIVDLDPGLAFGTGTHQTTALCLSWIDGQDLSGKRLIDFGCGSGVLAVAALKMGASRAIAVDHDPQALLATRENGKRNQVSDRLEVMHSSAFTPATADVVIANILANTLIELSVELLALLRPGSDLVLSGILRDQAEAVAKAYRARVDFRPAETRDDWVLLHGRAR